MKTTIALALALATATPAFATQGDANPCGNHGNNCCTEDGGESYTSVAATCESFCSSTAFAVSVAVSEAASTCSSTCSAQAGDSSASCAQQIETAVTSATASCAQTCSVPLCLKWRIRYVDGHPVARTCKRTAEQPL